MNTPIKRLNEIHNFGILRDIEIPNEYSHSFAHKIKQLARQSKKDEPELIEAGLPKDFSEHIMEQIEIYENEELGYEIHKFILDKIKREWALRQDEICNVKIDMLCSLAYAFEISKEDRSELNSILKIDGIEEDVILLNKLLDLSRSKNEIMLDKHIEQGIFLEAQSLIEEINAMHSLREEQVIYFIEWKKRRDTALNYLRQAIEKFQDIAVLAFNQKPRKLTNYLSIGSLGS